LLYRSSSPTRAISVLAKMEFQYRLPVRLARVRARFGLFLWDLANKYLKTVETSRLQRGFDETFRRQAESPTWRAVCGQVFDSYLGQLSFATVAQIHLLAEKLHVNPQSNVLDLACGTGGLGLYLAELTGCHINGVDMSPFAIKSANKRARSSGLADRARFEVGILPDLSYEDCSFDAVMSIDSVYCIPDRASLFRGCYRVLRPSGYLGIYTLYQRRNLLLENPMHRRAFLWFPSQPYSNLIQRAGFKGLWKIDLTEDLIQLAKRWVDAIKENRGSLEKEMGAARAGDQTVAWSLATEGYIGRALFKTQRPAKAHTSQAKEEKVHLQIPMKAQ